MKKIGLLFLFSSALLCFSCSSGKKHEVYQCPMKCEGEKTYSSAQSCPICEMELEAID